MRIRAVDTDSRRDIRQFVQFPFQHYRDCPRWVPPLLSDARRSLDRQKHPFYRHSDAQFFLAESGGKALGRLAVVHHGPYNQNTDAKAAFFSLFESVDDRDVSNGLFEAAFDWSRSRGLVDILGPKTFGGAEPSGILVKGFEHRPALGMPYNYDYYDGLVMAAGFDRLGGSLSGYLSGAHELSDRFYALAEKVKKRKGFWVKTFSSKAQMREWAPRVIEIYGEAFQEMEDFSPPTEDEVAGFANMLLTIAHPSLIKLVMKGEDVIGFLFAYHDISGALQRARGRLFPFGWYYLLTARRRTQWVNINGAGVLPAYQGRGASILLYTEMAKTVRSFNFRHAEVVAVGEENIKSRSDMETIGVDWYKLHRSYRRTL